MAFYIKHNEIKQIKYWFELQGIESSRGVFHMKGFILCNDWLYIMLLNTAFYKIKMKIK